MGFAVFFIQLRLERIEFSKRCEILNGKFYLLSQVCG